MTTQQHRNNPLHGVGLKVMLEELVEQYGWEILALQLKINSFEKFPSIRSAHKFLHKTQWAREKTEAFYLYKYKQLPIPSDEEHVFPPRERTFEADLASQLPAIITESDREFFDDPVSGPKFRTPFDKNLSKEKSPRRSNSDGGLYGKRSDEPSAVENKEPSKSEQRESLIEEITEPSSKESLMVVSKGSSSNETEGKEPSVVEEQESSAEEDKKPSSEGSTDPWGKWRK